MKTWEEVLKSLEAEKTRLTDRLQNIQRLMKSAFAVCGNKTDVKELTDEVAVLPTRIKQLELIISLVQARYLGELQIEQCLTAIASRIEYLKKRVKEIEWEIVELGREEMLYEDMARIAGIFSFRS